MYDILVVNKDYEAEGSDSISVKAGDLVEVIDMGSTDQGAKYVKISFEQLYEKLCRKYA